MILRADVMLGIVINQHKLRLLCLLRFLTSFAPADGLSLQNVNNL